MRAERKKEHLENYLRTSHTNSPLFNDVYLEHNALPLLSIDEIDTSTTFLGKKINYPLMIGAITGGGDFADEINRQLAELACRYQIPMAVGSQTIALELGEPAEHSFRVVRETMCDTRVVIANLNANATVKGAQEAVEMLNADALQIHLNIAQELVMPEGDRDFRHALEHLEAIRDAISVPVVIKEVGYGISAPVAQKLYDRGFRYFDLAGAGGTNFIEIENLRSLDRDYAELYDWGIPTAKAVHDVCKALPEDATVVASGGVRTSLDVAKSIVLGADLCGASGEILSYLIHGGEEQAAHYMEELFYKLKVVMMMVGAKNLEELKKIPYKITGRLAELIR